MQNLYETLLIVTPDADDERVNAVIGDLRTVIENDGGNVLQAGVWERRKLAYQVQGKSEGIYVLIYADGDNTLPAALKHRMKLDESVIRSMVVRLEDQQEKDVREEIATADHSHESELIEAQRAAAERRHEAEAAAAAMSLEEQVAAESAGVALEEVAAVIVDGEGSDVAAAIEEVVESGEPEPADEVSAESDEAVSDEAPSDEALSDEAPSDEAPSDEAPSDDDSADEHKEN